jgi:hypothetical protein
MDRLATRQFAGAIGRLQRLGLQALAENRMISVKL